MPPVKPPAKVLVTGASGYIAMWIVRTLLERRFAVRGTVRSHEKGEYLRKAFSSYGDKFEFVVVPDMAKEGAFDEAVKGVDAIEHTASPFHLHADDPQEMIEPAVKGTVEILKAALEHGPSVKRIAITSSVAAVMAELPEPKLFTAADWNDQAMEAVEKQGKGATAHQKYCASKTLAEKAAWKFYEEHKSSVKWDLVVFNPPMVFGPPIHEVHDPASLNTSVAQWYNIVVAKKERASAEVEQDYIDVRDVAIAHVDGLENPEAGGLRFLITAGPYTWKHFVDIADGEHPGDKRSMEETMKRKKMYCDKPAREILGIKYRSMEETTKDTLAAFKARGWI